MFIVFAISLLIRHRNSPTKRDSSFSAFPSGSIAFMTLLACLSKPTAIVTPLILAVLDRTMFSTAFRRTALELAPAVIIATIFAAVGKGAQPPIAAYVAPAYIRPLIATDALAFYMFKLVVPIHLSIDYVRTPQAVIESGSLYWTWIVPAFTFAILLALWRRFNSAASRFRLADATADHSSEHPSIASLVARMPLGNRALIIAGPLITLLALLPVLGLIPFTFQAFSTVADHYLYPAMLGIAFLIAGVAAFVDWRSLQVFVVCIAILALATISFLQAGYWQDGPLLFARVIELNPRSKIAHTNLAAEYRVRGDVASAQLQLRAAIEADPDDAFAQLSLFDLAMQRNDFSAARDAFHEVMRIYPLQKNFDPKLAAQVAMEFARQFESKGDAVDAGDAEEQAQQLTLRPTIEQRPHD